MSKVPLPSDEMKQVNVTGPKNWLETFQALCKRNGTNMNKQIITFIQEHLEQNLDNDVVPTATLMAVKEIVGGIWVNRGGTVRDPSLKPVVCIACGKEQYHVPPDMADHPAHGYCHHVKSKGPNDQCVCLDCLVATAIMATSHDDLMSTKIEGFYNLNKWELQNTPEGKRVNAKLESYRATYFRNLPQLNDATDEEVLACFTMKVERGAARRDTDFDQMLEYSDEFKLNSYVHPDTKIRPDEAHRPTAREWKKEWYAYPTKWLLEEGREILAAPHRASHPVKVARNLIFDAAALALKKATGRATLAEIMDAALDATRAPVAAPAPVQKIAPIVRLEPVEGFYEEEPNYRRWVMCDGNPMPSFALPKDERTADQIESDKAEYFRKLSEKRNCATQPPTPIAAQPVQVPTQPVATSIQSDVARPPEGELPDPELVFWHNHEAKYGFKTSRSENIDPQGVSNWSLLDDSEKSKMRRNTGSTFKVKNTLDWGHMRFEVPKGGWYSIESELVK